MEPDAPLAGASPARHRILPAFLLGTALILGLMGMHILGMYLPGASMTAADGHANHPPTVETAPAGGTTPNTSDDQTFSSAMNPAAAVATPDGMPTAADGADPALAMVGQGAHDACGGHCDDPMPHHPVLMTCCELTLSTTGPAAAHPSQLALPVAVARHIHSAPPTPAEPIPPPPSLVVLSISRT